jgi:anti-sigma-K factor RskA
MSGEPMPPGDERDWLAAEHALGLLDGEALAEAERLMAADPDFRRSVGAWTGHLAPLLDEIEPKAPPEAAWGRLEARLGALAEPPRRTADNVVALRRRIVLWRRCAAAATALAASLAFFLILRPGQAPAPVAPPAAAPAPPLVATLEASDSPVRLVATYEPASRSLVVVAAAGLSRAPGHSHQLWLIPAGGAPRPLGIVVPGTPLRLAVAAPDASALSPAATLAVSVEPTGGSPTGLPTGPVIAAGKLVRT